VGHSEQRLHHQETNELVAQKAALLMQHGISPIVCIGESGDEHRNNQTYAVLERQLKPVIKICVESSYAGPLCIATHPTRESVTHVCAWIRNFFNRAGSVRILYGGHVDATTMSIFKNIPLLDGFLLGRAGLDAQVLRDIMMALQHNPSV
jgi:triosephosphate isomerase